MIHYHPGQSELQAEIILASQGPFQKPIYTIRMRYPRIIHSEIMTHRVFSRNARSSRAVPVARMIEEVRTKPFVPWHWFKNKPGMQGTERLTPEEEEEAKEIWLQASHYAMEAVDQLFDPDGLNIHKQNPNRLLEPFSWIDTLITSTDWSNFLWLRDHKDAEPHLQDLARLVGQAIEAAEIQELELGQWHLPYITNDDLIALSTRPEVGTSSFTELVCQISAARCARISYAPFDGDASYERELERYNSLVSSDRIHASPLEHQATPDIAVTISSDIFFKNNLGLSPDETLDAYDGWLSEDLHGNLTGYVQFRKTVPGENHT